MSAKALTSDHGRAGAGEESCPFCPTSLAASLSPFDTVLASGPRVSLVPALGMLVPGYLLAVTDSHVLSMAEENATTFKRRAAWVNMAIQRLAPAFGNYFIFEHGSCAASRSGACIDHAHTHLIPLADEMRDGLLSVIPWLRMHSPDELRNYAGRPYAYLGLVGEWFVLPEPTMRSQWIRQQVAEFLGLTEWDWAIDFGNDNLRKTLEAIQSLRLLEFEDALTVA